jgi:hypothetical protein
MFALARFAHRDYVSGLFPHDICDDSCDGFVAVRNGTEIGRPVNSYALARK